MATQLLTTKLNIPPVRPDLVPRTHLIERLNQGLRIGHRLTLISAPAGFGKTTLLAEWAAEMSESFRTPQPSTHSRLAWLSLDDGDNDLARLLTYLIAP